MNRKAILVTGSRDWKIAGIIEDQLLEAAPTLVIHGDARGADTIAEEWCAKHLVKSLPCPADWDSFGKAAGPRRNRRMRDILLALKECKWDVSALAYPIGDSPGTRGMITLLNEVFIPCKVTEG